MILHRGKLIYEPHVQRQKYSSRSPNFGTARSRSRSKMTYLHPDIVKRVVARTPRYVKGSTAPSVVIPSILMGLNIIIIIIARDTRKGPLPPSVVIPSILMGLDIIIIIMGLLLETRGWACSPLGSHSLYAHGSR